MLAVVGWTDSRLSAVVVDCVVGEIADCCCCCCSWAEKAVEGHCCCCCKGEEGLPIIKIPTISENISRSIAYSISEYS